jgi:hypothetical protein
MLFCKVIRDFLTKNINLSIYFCDMPTNFESADTEVTLFAPPQRPDRHLLYTVAIDPPGHQAHAQLAKLLASSLLRTWFTGDIFIFRNTPTPLFPVGRPGLVEVELNTDDYHSYRDEQEAWRYKFRVREYLDVKGYDKVVFMDADCLALRNIDHLLEGDWDIAYQPEGADRKLTMEQFNCFLTDDEMRTLKGRLGVNSGTLAVKAEHFHTVMEAWEAIDLGPTNRRRNCSDQASWNRLLLDTPLKKHIFEPGEILFPLFLHSNYHDWKNAAVLHSLGGSVQEKQQFNFGVFMQKFFWDPQGIMMRLLEM